MKNTIIYVSQIFDLNFGCSSFSCVNGVDLYLGVYHVTLFMSDRG